MLRLIAALLLLTVLVLAPLGCGGPVATTSEPALEAASATPVCRTGNCTGPVSEDWLYGGLGALPR